MSSDAVSALISVLSAVGPAIIAEVSSGSRRSAWQSPNTWGSRTCPVCPLNGTRVLEARGAIVLWQASLSYGSVSGALRSATASRRHVLPVNSQGVYTNKAPSG